jgi:FKBP-type peptidyl-prolyl cis-trans isomerase 2
MNVAKVGDRVRIQYCRLPENAASAGGTRQQKTLEFTVGSRKVLRLLSLGVVGMAPGDRRQFTLQPHEGYGTIKRKLIRQVSRKRIPAHIELYVGKRLSVTRGLCDLPRRVTVVEIRPEGVIVDGNHPLAGKVIELEVYLLSLDSSSNANQTKQQYDIGGES